MRSSKSRSRSKSNRPRSLGNIVNRVFDSSGPEGKVRGTPAQIIEKYLFLARDAQLSNDRVAAENFLQHAEHYTRLLGEAQRELAAEQENRRSDYQPTQNGPSNGSSNGSANGQPNGNQRQERPRDERPRDDRPREDRRDDRTDDRQPRAEREPRVEPPQPQPAEDVGSSHEVIDLDAHADADSGLVETPEARPRHRPAARRAPEPAAEVQAPAEPPAAPAATPEAATEAAGDAPKADRPRRPRGPRKPKPRSEGDGDTPDGDGPREAAE